MLEPLGSFFFFTFVLDALVIQSWVLRSHAHMSFLSYLLYQMKSPPCRLLISQSLVQYESRVLLKGQELPLC